MKFPANTDRSRFSLKSALLALAACALVSAPAALCAQGAGYWHTSGSQIFDFHGNPIRITGINWFGFETKDEVVHGLANQDYRQILHTIAASGFNTIRLPYSNQMVEHPIVPFPKSAGPLNGDLVSLNSLQIMDKIVSAAGAEGLKIILDDHRSEAGDSNESSGLWYTRAYPESSWIADWEAVVSRYKNFTDAAGNPVVIGVDLRNEPYSMVNGQPTGSCWTGDTTTAGCPVTDTAHNWPEAAGRAANAVLNVNPNLLVFVEGVDCYSGSCNWQGGNLEGAGRFPVSLPFSGHLVYSAHDYGPSVSTQPWFNGATTVDALRNHWTKEWAYLAIGNVAPVWIGEFGTDGADKDIQDSTPGSQGQWFSALVNFLRAQPRINWAYWAVNGEDSTGLLTGNYTAPPPGSIKMAQLASIQFSPSSSPEPQVQATSEDDHPIAAQNSDPHGVNGVQATAALSLVAFALVLVQRRKPRDKELKGSPSPQAPEILPPDPQQPAI